MLITLKRKKHILNICRLAIVVAFFSMASNKSFSQIDRSGYEYAAEKLYFLAGFVNWEMTELRDTSKLIFGVYNTETYDTEIFIEEMTNKLKNNGKSHWKVTRFDEPLQIKKCHILFIPSIETSEIIKITTHINGTAIVTVGDNFSEFCKSGVMINMLHNGNENKGSPFQINNTVTEESPVKISSQVMQISKLCE